MSIGMILNNPFDLKIDQRFKWQGEVRPSTDPKGIFCQFFTIADGLRAGVKDIRNQQLLHRLNNVRDIITKYAPSIENNTGTYILAVCRALGVDPKDEIDLSDSITLANFSKAIIVQEQGSYPFSAGQMTQAVFEVLGQLPTIGV